MREKGLLLTEKGIEIEIYKQVLSYIMIIEGKGEITVEVAEIENQRGEDGEVIHEIDDFKIIEEYFCIY